MSFASRQIRRARRLAAVARSRHGQDGKHVKDRSVIRFARATVSRRDLRGAATTARVVARWAGDLADEERDEAERIATRLDQLAATDPEHEERKRLFVAGLLDDEEEVGP